VLKLDVNRREFLKIACGTGAALAMPAPAYMAAASPNDRHPGGAVSFADEGAEEVLDVLQERARVNTLLLAVFTAEMTLYHGRDRTR
jgi:hypothetical protein